MLFVLSFLVYIKFISITSSVQGENSKKKGELYECNTWRWPEGAETFCKNIYTYIYKGKATPVTGRGEAHRVVTRRGFHIF
jgi:hypothetical protein